MNFRSRPSTRKAIAACGLGLLISVSGCDFGQGGSEPLPAPRAPNADELLTAGTVGGATLVTNGAPQELRGFGLVIGLNGRGSSDCPTSIREYLEDWLGKQIPPQIGGSRRPQAPGELIDSLDTAVVEVVGQVPPGARRGSHFDLQVRALAGTATQSLEGGLLLPTEMRYFDRAASGQGLVAGAALARAGGPVSINPFAVSPTNARSDLNPREGTILGGGRTTEERTTRLMLINANYQLARTIQDRINERFGQRRKLASAVSAQQVEVSTPPAYDRQYDRFRAALAQVYLDNRPGVCDQKLRELATRAAAPGADLEKISATWEAAGTAALPHIQPFYTDSAPLLRLYAARTGLRLGDNAALPVMQAFAASGTHDQRLVAIDELGHADSPQAPLTLAPLLNDANQEVRIAAYEALVQRGHAAIRSLPFPHEQDPAQINLVLDVVDSSGPPLIYVRRARLPRIAVFGGRMSVAAPVFYSDPEDLLTVHTVGNSTDVQVFARRQGRLTDPIVMPPRVVDLITALADLPTKDEAGRLRGVGLSFSRVVQTLVALARDGTLAAQIAFEQTSLTDLLGPERPESERPEAEPAPEATSAPADGDAEPLPQAPQGAERPELTEPEPLAPAPAPGERPEGG